MINLIIPSEKHLVDYLDYCRVTYDSNAARIICHDPDKFYYWKDSIITKYHIASIHDKIIRYWAFDGNNLIGEVIIRLDLDETTLKEGGNIEFCVSKKYQNQGYGTPLLLEALKKAKRHGIIKALLTCNDDDAVSIKIIENCGGRLENKVINFSLTSQNLTRRYWINLYK